MSKKELDYYKSNFRNCSVLLPWKYFVAVLTKIYGFEVKKKRGSNRIFFRENERFNADEPHGRESYVSKWDRKKAIKALIRLGELDESE
jgi:hypothetical protein